MEKLHATVRQEDKWFVAQCLEYDIASQGISEENALINLKEAIELYFEEPTSTIKPMIKELEVSINAS